MSFETRYVPSADQLAIASEIEESIADLLPLARLHASHADGEKIWSGLGDMGIFGICLPEDRGGSALGSVEETQIVVGLGRRLASPGILAGIAVAHVDPEFSGRRVAVAYRHGQRSLLVAGEATDLVLLRSRDGATLHESASCRSRGLDDRLWLAELREIEQIGDPVARMDGSKLLRLRLIDAAALMGIAAGALDMSVAYAQMRQQFGRPIGSFQAVKHHCANMAIAARSARDQVSFASVALEDGRDDAALQVECALLVAGSAALENAGKNIQVHGGMGFSDEADPHLFLKRAQLMIAIAGGLEAATAQIANIKTDW